MKRTYFTSALAVVCLAVFAGPVFAGSVKGTVMFEGDKPGRKRVKMGADPACEKLHSKPVGTEDYMIKSTGEVYNAFVYIKGGDGKDHPVPEEHAELNQKGCMYEPHVQGMQVNQTLDIVNSDPTMHNVHCLATENKEFNFGQPTPGTREQVFRRAENAIPFKCDVHPWMNAYIFVMDHPYFDVSEGTFEISNVPAGTYTLVAWHEKLGELEQEITVGDGDLEGVTFTFTNPEKK